jgi:hypothetical protein
LLTVKGFLNIVSAFAGASVFTYGTSKYMLEPMVESLTEARISLHETANSGLSKVIEKLEETVSEIPPETKTEANTEKDGNGLDEDQSSYGDPSEMFHRDVGVQTSRPTTPLGSLGNQQQGSSTAPEENPSEKQARRLGELAASVRAISDGFVTQSEELVNIKQAMDVFKEDLDKLTFPARDFVGAYSLYSTGMKNEPDDEIKRAKENVRRVKGVLLSARSFPGSAR